MNKLRRMTVLLVLCLSLVLSQTATSAPIETVKEDINVIAQHFVDNAEISSEMLGYLQYTDTIEDGNTTWYLIVSFVNKQPNMIYMQEEITTDNGKIIYFDGISLSYNSWIDDCYGYNITKDNTVTYLEEGCVKSWNRGIKKFKNKYGL